MSSPLKKGRIIKTGLPSSVVDLYHQNRCLLKKPTKKKRSKRHNSAGDSISQNSSPKCSTKLLNQETCPTKLEKSRKEKVIVAVLNILFVLVLRMVIGVSMSAFSLFFLEYVGKYLYGLFKPCLCSPSMKRTDSFGAIERDDSSQVNSGDSDCSNLSSLSVERPNLEAESDYDPRFSEITNADYDDEMFSKIQNDWDCISEGSSAKRRRRKRDKVKSKMKKLVPKRIMKSMKKRSGIKNEGPILVEEDNFVENDYDTEPDDLKEDAYISDSANSDAFEQMQSGSDTSEVEEKVERPRATAGSWNYWYLCFIVLAGLVEGRSLAAVLTVIWCLLVKLVECLRKYGKLP